MAQQVGQTLLGFPLLGSDCRRRFVDRKSTPGRWSGRGRRDMEAMGVGWSRERRKTASEPVDVVQLKTEELETLLQQGCARRVQMMRVGHGKGGTVTNGFLCRGWR